MVENPAGRAVDLRGGDDPARHRRRVGKSRSKSASTSGTEQSAATIAATPVPPRVLAKPPAIEDLLGAKNVEHDGNRLVVIFNTGTLWSDKDLVIRAGQQFERIAKWAAPDFAKRLPEEVLAMKIVTPAIDQYGNEKIGDAMWLSIKTADLAKVNWRNVGSDGALNVADIVVAGPLSRSSSPNTARMKTARISHRISVGKSHGEGDKKPETAT